MYRFIVCPSGDPAHTYLYLRGHQAQWATARPAGTAPKSPHLPLLSPVVCCVLGAPLHRWLRPLVLSVPIFKGRRARPPLVYHSGHERTCRVHQPEGESESLAWVVSNALFT